MVVVPRIGGRPPESVIAHHNRWSFPETRGFVSNRKGQVKLVQEEFPHKTFWLSLGVRGGGYNNDFNFFICGFRFTQHLSCIEILTRKIILLGPTFFIVGVKILFWGAENIVSPVYEIEHKESKQRK